MTVLPRPLLAAGVLAAATALASVLVAPAAAEGGRPLSAVLTGTTEVPGPGDPDGSGTAHLRVNPGTEQVCVDLFVQDIAPARAAHIHRGVAWEVGPVVVGLTPPSDGSSSGCYPVDRELALALIRNPEQYYVNVHNADHPAGAVRGQLSR